MQKPALWCILVRPIWQQRSLYVAALLHLFFGEVHFHPPFHINYKGTQQWSPHWRSSAAPSFVLTSFLETSLCRPPIRATEPLRLKTAFKKTPCNKNAPLANNSEDFCSNSETQRPSLPPLASESLRLAFCHWHLIGAKSSHVTKQEVNRVISFAVCARTSRSMAQTDDTSPREQGHTGATHVVQISVNLQRLIWSCRAPFWKLSY